MYADDAAIVAEEGAELGKMLKTLERWADRNNMEPSKRFLIIPVVLRALFIPLFLLCNYHVGDDLSVRALPVLIDNDWIYLAIGIIMGLSSGYFSSLGMMYCPTEVDPRHSSTAGMFAAAALITGIFFGVLSSNVMPLIVNNISW
ncbi:equilibrative nucleoside transporter 2 [Fopius arisanus]|uniref:Equilibrative nucleoside transporter 2 n=1 Tax=Fopius arisanus TaxID=64838 RepID=A0A9R1TPU7_9HYME|nr:PREDICTED: equilibrative nucleoside transporter 2-like [Fopius arisanus]